jgi:outer membrane protein assembly factor BamB
MLTVTSVVLLGISIAAQEASRPAAGWPGLWGPSRNASTSAFASPPRSAKNLWHRPSQGGYAELAVAGQRLVTMELRDGVDYVVALDPETGKDLWATRIGPTYRGHDSSEDGPIATPAIDGADVFAAGPHGVFVALDLESGRERWRHDLGASFGTAMPVWGFAASPLVEGQLVIVAAGGAKGPGLLAFDRASGKLRWSAKESFLLRIVRQGTRLAAEEVWRSPRTRVSMSPAIHVNGSLYAFSGGQFMCIDPATGESRWRERLGDGTLAAAGTTLFLVTRAGDLIIVEASPDGYRESFRTRAFGSSGSTVTGPSIANGRVYLRSTREVAAFTVGS